VSDSLTTPRERRRAQTTAEILDAAWRLARRDGLTAISMRELGREVGLRAQSLYAYVESKSALYDAMFRQGQEQLIAASAEWPTDLGTVADPRAAAKRIAREWAEFCAADPVRYQLMFQRVIPDWEPSPETYALAVDRVDDLRRALAGVGIVGEEAVDLFTAVVTGITAQQLSNDPGGDRWLRLIDTAVDMFFDHLRLDEPDRSPGGTP
jgi:AcrR family transcriptional regulator